MNEAKRRKTAATAPDGRAVEGRCYSGGTVTFVFVVAGAEQFSLVIAAERLVDLLATVAPVTAGMEYYEAIVGFGIRFRELRTRRADADLDLLAMVGTWLALHHPAAGERVRRSVSIGMRRDERVYVTVAIGPVGLAIGVASHFLDLAATAAAAPVMATVLEYDGEDLGSVH